MTVVKVGDAFPGFQDKERMFFSRKEKTNATSSVLHSLFPLLTHQVVIGLF